VPDCDYCEASFESEDDYLNHLEDSHYEELGRIDRRRIGLEGGEEDGGFSTDTLLLGGTGALVVGLLGLVLFLVLSSGGGSGSSIDAQQQPQNVGSVHTHGTIEMVVDGQQVDFSQGKYQLQADAFHFERGVGTRWHVHAQEVTFEWAMASLGIDVTESTVTYEGATYRDSDSNTNVTVTVNGESVTPSEYVLREGDEIRIIVETS
jgi:molybdopterin converting factor small subunit